MILEMEEQSFQYPKFTHERGRDDVFRPAVHLWLEIVSLSNKVKVKMLFFHPRFFKLRR